MTRYCLEQLLKFDFPISIQTKSSLVSRDIDLFKKFSDIEIIFSISTLNDFERQKLEPASSPIKDRLDSLKKLNEEKIKTNVFFGPIYPTISIEDVSFIIDIFIDNKVNNIWIDRFNLKPGIWNNIKKNIQNDNIMYSTFYKKFFIEKNYYEKLRDYLLKIGYEKNIKIVDAF